MEKETKPVSQEDPKPEKAPATEKKRRYRYIGRPTQNLMLPDFRTEINPNTVDDDKIERLIRRFPVLSKTFEKAG